MARRTKRLSIKSDFLVLTNGEKTEKDYFDIVKKHSIFNVVVRYENADPKQLVERAINEPFSRKWCMFDIDQFHDEGKIIPALELAYKNGIKCAYSNIKFEVWLLSHFKKQKGYLSSPELDNELRKEIEKKYKKEYSKTDSKLFKKMIEEKLENAITNSRIVYEQHLKDFNQSEKKGLLPIWEWNSSTNVFELIIALQLKSCCR